MQATLHAGHAGRQSCMGCRAEGRHSAPVPLPCHTAAPYQGNCKVAPHFSCGWLHSSPQTCRSCEPCPPWGCRLAPGHAAAAASQGKLRLASQAQLRPEPPAVHPAPLAQSCVPPNVLGFMGEGQHAPTPWHQSKGPEVSHGPGMYMVYTLQNSAWRCWSSIRASGSEVPPAEAAGYTRPQPLSSACLTTAKSCPAGQACQGTAAASLSRRRDSTGAPLFLAALTHPAC